MWPDSLKHWINNLNELWELEATTLVAFITVGNSLYVHLDGTVKELDGATGKVIRDLGVRAGSLAHRNGILVVGNGAAGYNLKTGKLVWTSKPGGRTMGGL